MYKLLHNPRCSKSRIALEYMEKLGEEFEVIEYLKDPLSFEELLDLKEKLALNAIEFTRKKESEFKEAWLSNESSDEDILRAMVEYPKLIERPILIKEDRAVIGRPIENFDLLTK